MNLASQLLATGLHLKLTEVINTVNNTVYTSQPVTYIAYYSEFYTHNVLYDGTIVPTVIDIPHYATRYTYIYVSGSYTTYTYQRLTTW